MRVITSKNYDISKGCTTPFVLGVKTVIIMGFEKMKNSEGCNR